MPITRVFYAQPIDSVPSIIIRENVEKLRVLMKEVPVEIVAPYLDELNGSTRAPVDRKDAQQIVEKDCAALDACDMLLVDLAREDRQAVGMIFEIAYAWSTGKTIVVYTGGSSISKRVWITAVADYICETWLEVRACMKKCLGV